MDRKLQRAPAPTCSAVGGPEAGVSSSAEAERGEAPPLQRRRGTEAATTTTETAPGGRQKRREPLMVVVVSSNPRSGSTFLGELLASPANAIYFYEPFRYSQKVGKTVTRNMHLSPDKSKSEYVQNELLQLFTCNLTESMFDPVLKFFIWHKPTLEVPVSANQRISICKDHEVRVAKVIRPGLGSVLPLLQLENHNIHIVHLVRDPRAIINSIRSRESWAATMTPEKVCGNLALDLDSALDITSRRFTTVRYEDLIADTAGEARRLFTWLGLEPTIEVKRFIKMHTESTDPRVSMLDRIKYLLKSKLKSRPSLHAGPPASLDASSRPEAELELPATTARRRRRRAAKKKNWKSQVDFKGYYGTYRDVSFDGLHWINELPEDVRGDVERKCANLLKRLDYPLLYPGEKSAGRSGVGPGTGV